MSGGGGGFCVLRMPSKPAEHVVGTVGLSGRAVTLDTRNRKEFIMPGGDGTGPMGMGPLSGRGIRFCGGNGAPGFVVRGGRFGGRGRGRRNMYYATGLTGQQRAAMGMQAFGGTGSIAAPSEEQQVSVLEQQAQILGRTLEQVNQRIAEIRGRQAKKE